MNEPILRTAIQAALEAGTKIMTIYRKGFAVDYKADQSPLTEADLASNTIINAYLEPTGVPIISEENKPLDYAIRKAWKSCWIVDPLDGTKEFVKQNDEFTVNIALVANGQVVFGVIYAPALNVLYYTNASKTKAYRAEVDGANAAEIKLFNEADEIQASEIMDNQIRVVASRSHLNDKTKAFIDDLELKYNEVSTVSRGSSLKFCLVAEGKADIYPRFAPTMEWDTAAGQAICEAVGLQVIDIDTEHPMVYNREDLLNNYFLVGKHGA